MLEGHPALLWGQGAWLRCPMAWPSSDDDAAVPSGRLYQ